MMIGAGAVSSRAVQFGILAISGLLVAGCSSPSSDTGGGSRLGNLLAFNTSTPKEVVVGQAAVYCPPVSVQPGTAAFTLYERGQEGNIMAVTNQANFGELARECADVGGQNAIRVGISGRLIQGPKGTVGNTVPIPVRFVVLDPDDKPVATRVTRLQTAIPPGQSGVSFTHVEEFGGLPGGPQGMRGYSVRVGFETAATGR
jgi:hypothetical protein